VDLLRRTAAEAAASPRLADSPVRAAVRDASGRALERRASRLRQLMVLSRTLLRQWRARAAHAVVNRPRGPTRFQPAPAGRRRVRGELSATRATDEAARCFVTALAAEPEKNIGFGLELVAPGPPDARYVVLATATCAGELVARAAALGPAAARDPFLGVVDAPQDYLAAADLSLHTGVGRAVRARAARGHGLRPAVAAAAGRATLPRATEELVPRPCGVRLDLDDPSRSAGLLRTLLGTPRPGGGRRRSGARARHVHLGGHARRLVACATVGDGGYAAMAHRDELVITPGR